MEGRLDLAVLESRWWKTSNDSVRGLFDMLAGMHKDNPFAYHYEMFNNADSLRELIPRIAKMKDVHNIYIGAHGAEDGSALLCPGGRVSRTVLANILQPISARRLYGLFLGVLRCRSTDGVVDAEGNQINLGCRLYGISRLGAFFGDGPIFLARLLQLKRCKGKDKTGESCRYA